MNAWHKSKPSYFRQAKKHFSHIFWKAYFYDRKSCPWCFSSEHISQCHGGHAGPQLSSKALTHLSCLSRLETLDKTLCHVNGNEYLVVMTETLYTQIKMVLETKGVWTCTCEGTVFIKRPLLRLVQGDVQKKKLSMLNTLTLEINILSRCLEIMSDYSWIKFCVLSSNSKAENLTLNNDIRRWGLNS